MKRLLASLLAVCLAISCTHPDTKEKALEKTAAPPPEHVIDGPRIILKGSEITYNGKPLKLGVPLEEFIAIIGEEPRSWKNGRLYVWDNLGLYSSMRTNNRKKVGSLQIRLNRRPINQYNPYMNEVPGEHYPLKLFRGYLEIDGVAVWHDSTIEQINDGLLEVNSHLFPLDCKTGINICVNVAGSPEGSQVFVGADTDDRKYNGVIYAFGFEDIYDRSTWPPIE